MHTQFVSVEARVVQIALCTSFRCCVLVPLQDSLLFVMTNTISTEVVNNYRQE